MGTGPHTGRSARETTAEIALGGFQYGHLGIWIKVSMALFIPYLYHTYIVVGASISACLANRYRWHR
jgi:hypothetical protein